MRTATAVLAAALVALLSSASADAAVTCAFNAGSKSLSITSDAHADEPQIARGAGGSTAVIVRSGPSTPIACSGGTPTVTTINTISFNDTGINANTYLTIDMTNGRFEPGATAEPAGDSEIEMNFNLGGGSDSIVVRGTSQSDVFRVGTTGADSTDFNLNAGEAVADADVHALSVAQTSLITGDGDDIVDYRGGAGTGSPIDIGQGAFLGDGDDTAWGTTGQGTWLLGDGDDTVSVVGGYQSIVPGPGNDVVDGGATGSSISFYGVLSPVRVDLEVTTPQDTGEGIDTLSHITSVTSGPFDDVLLGTPGINYLSGSEGDDFINGRGGEDYLDGYLGNDTVTFAWASQGVSVKLGYNMQYQETGLGQMVIGGFETLIGSSFADTLTGSFFGETIDGGAGADTIAAGNGPDKVLVRDGDGDIADCGDGEDTAETDVAGVDTVSNCEAVDATPGPPTGTGDPGAGGTSGSDPAGGGGDATAPALTALRFKPRAFRARRGGRLLATVSEPVTLFVTIERCAKTCKRVRTATIAVAQSGPSRLKLRTRGLKRGRYRARIVARDAAGNSTPERRARFRLRR